MNFSTKKSIYMEMLLQNTINQVGVLAAPLSNHLVVRLRGFLNARMEDILQNPIGCPVPGADRTEASVESVDHDDLFDFLNRLVPQVHSSRLTVDDDGRCRVPLDFDIDDQWRGQEKELLDALHGCRDETIWLLTPSQWQLLLNSPQELLSLNPPPIEGRLVEVETEQRGGREVPVIAIVEELSSTPKNTTHFALAPNLTPIRRMKAALDVLTAPGCPEALRPLQALLGMGSAPEPVAPPPEKLASLPGERLDFHQQSCVHQVIHTPHLALVQGPPGSGKTTVIRSIIEREVRVGHRVLVVSPTHVAVDNVTEKLWPNEAGEDAFAVHSLPVRWASRPHKLSKHAREAWQSSSRNERLKNLAARIERRMLQSPQLRELWSRLEPKQPCELSHAPITRALAETRQVICGTPIGILSAPDLKEAQPGEFDLLIVDEVSKLTLPEFLAVAVYARRWALIGDPAQLPPFLDAREAAICLADTYGRYGELAASTTACIEALRPPEKDELRLVVVTRDPEAVVAAIQTQFRVSGVRVRLPVQTLETPVQRHQPGILVCTPNRINEATEALAPLDRRRFERQGLHPGSVAVLVEQGVYVPRPEHASGVRLVEDRDRAPARMMALCHDLLHTLPWAQELQIQPPALGRSKGLPALLPLIYPSEQVERVCYELATLYALSGLSVYDWIAGLPTADWPSGPLAHLGQVVGAAEELRRAVSPWTSTLRTQYRMHPEISRVPRELFYGGAALEDGRRNPPRGGVRLIQVTAEGRVAEDNQAECLRILKDLTDLDTHAGPSGQRIEVLLITPYRRQEKLLASALSDRRQAGKLNNIDIEVCTLDRCQGREAEVVMISLVRSQASAFLDNPKRWNVALTRARDHLLFYGDIAAYRTQIRQEANGRPPKKSVLTTILDAYHTQLHARSTP